MTTTTKSVELAKYIITCAKKNNIDIDKMKLHKLLYLCDGYLLATGVDLTDESPYAWNFGPIYQSVQIWLSENPDALNLPQECSAAVIDEIEKHDAKELLETAVSVYGDWDTNYLSLWTHKPDGPWESAINTHGRLDAPISRKDMKEYFRSLVENNLKH
jgi:uncharacterized phage-associated protein